MFFDKRFGCFGVGHFVGALENFIGEEVLFAAGVDKTTLSFTD